MAAAALNTVGTLSHSPVDALYDIGGPRRAASLPETGRGGGFRVTELEVPSQLGVASIGTVTVVSLPRRMGERAGSRWRRLSSGGEEAISRPAGDGFLLSSRSVPRADSEDADAMPTGLAETGNEADRARLR
jgi:hypothetical protein